MAVKKVNLFTNECVFERKEWVDWRYKIMVYTFKQSLRYPRTITIQNGNESQMRLICFECA